MGKGGGLARRKRSGVPRRRANVRFQSRMLDCGSLEQSARDSTSLKEPSLEKEKKVVEYRITEVGGGDGGRRGERV